MRNPVRYAVELLVTGATWVYSAIGVALAFALGLASAAAALLWLALGGIYAGFALKIPAFVAGRVGGALWLDWMHFEARRIDPWAGAAGPWVLWLLLPALSAALGLAAHGVLALGARLLEPHSQAGFSAESSPHSIASD